jgi:hypothetical protein
VPFFFVRARKTAVSLPTNWECGGPPHSQLRIA